MARRRFFVPEVRRGTAELSGYDAEHLVRVLRVEPGQVFEISDNQHVYLAEVKTARKSLVQFEVRERLTEAEHGADIILLPALIKFDSFEWMIEKATELGVGAIHPFEAVRSERGLLQASAKRLGRWQRIALEASQQSRRVRMPVITAAGNFTTAVRSGAELRLLLDESQGAPPILGTLPKHPLASDHVSFLLGPEGGWTEQERNEALSLGWKPCSLGDTILRAETATIAALSIVQAFWTAARAEHTATSLE